MSTITKEEFISYIKNKEGISWDKIVKAYCQEFNKREEDIDKLLLVLSLNSILRHECLDIAMEYFFDKLEVITLKDKKGILKDIY